MKFVDAVDANGVPLHDAALFAARAEHRLEWRRQTSRRAGWQPCPSWSSSTPVAFLSADVYELARLRLLVKSDACAAPKLTCARQLAPAAWGKVL